jgi:cytochrome c6
MISVNNKKIISAVLFLALCFAGNAVAGNPFKGKPLYERHCAECHADSGSTKMEKATNFKQAQGLMAPDVQILMTIRTGKGVMPGYQGLLKDEEILDIIAHLRTLF